MLDAHPHRKIFRFHMKAPVLQQFEGVARAVADGEDEERRFFPRAVHGKGGERAVCNTHVVELAAISDGAAVLQNIAAHVGDDEAELVAADVRAAEIGDLFGRAEFHERFQNFAVEGAIGLRVELAVRKGARAPFAELHVAVGSKYARLEEVCDVLGALFDGLAAFEKDGLNAVTDEAQGAEEPAGPAPAMNTLGAGRVMRG